MILTFDMTPHAIPLPVSLYPRWRQVKAVCDEKEQALDQAAKARRRQLRAEKNASHYAKPDRYQGKVQPSCIRGQ